MKKIDYVAVGKRIKVARKNLRLTQDKLAERLDISNTYMSEIERGKSICSLETIVKFAKELNMSLDYLIFGISESNIDYGFKELLKEISEEDYNLFFNLCVSTAKTLSENKKK